MRFSTALHCLSDHITASNMMFRISHVCIVIYFWMLLSVSVFSPQRDQRRGTTALCCTDSATHKSLTLYFQFPNDYLSQLLWPWLLFFSLKLLNGMCLDEKKKKMQALYKVNPLSGSVLSAAAALAQDEGKFLTFPLQSVDILQDYI